MHETILFNSVLSACDKASCWTHATSLMHDTANVHSMQRSEISFNAVLSGLSHPECLGLWQEGQDLFHKMRLESMCPNVISCNSLITIFEKNREWKHAQSFLEFFLFGELGDQEDAVSFNGVLSAYGKGQQWQKAQWQLLCLLKPGCSFQVSMVTFGACISAYAAAFAWERSVGLYQNLKVYSMQPNLVTCGAALSACERGQNWKLALLFVSQTNFKLGPVELNAALTACSSSHVTDRAFALTREMLSSRLQADLLTCNALLTTCSRETRWFEAIELLNGRSALGFKAGDFSHIQRDLLSFSAAMASCEGRPQEALEVLADAKISRILLDNAAVTSVIAACHSRNFWQQALYLSSLATMNLDAALLQLSLDSAVAGSCQLAATHLFFVATSSGEEALQVLRDNLSQKMSLFK